MSEIEKKFNVGAISATVWKNSTTAEDGKLQSYHTISIDRRYKDKEENWKSTSSMRLTDLPKVQLVANEAFRYLSLKEDVLSA